LNVIPDEQAARDAWCKICGYLLCSLPEPVCPECGRGFNPNDSSTFESRPPALRRKRRIKRGIVAAAVLAVILYAVVPRDILKGTLTFTCSQCGDVVRVERRELKPPRWMPWRYPGVAWNAAVASSAATTATPVPTSGFVTMSDETAIPSSSAQKPVSPKSCEPHLFNVSVRFDMHIGGWATGTGVLGPGTPLNINGVSTSPETARAVLENLMRPGNNGIGIGP
jgi:hypothetical protein